MEANKSAMKAMLMNRVGDWGVMVGMMYMYTIYESVEYSVVKGSVEGWEGGVMGVMIGYMMLGVIVKSAQIGMQMWLPNAMEAPTPVSALLHAATLVTAGVYLLMRMLPILEMVPNAMVIVGGLGGVTALYGGLGGVVQNDVKRVIAYSTCSQLGYMVMACGLSGYAEGLYHMVNHAYFKALLFLGAGCVIHGLGGEQDVRKMGGLRRMMPMIYVSMLVGSISLMALPYMSGYYTKDMIIESGMGVYRLKGGVGATLGVIGAGVTALYTVRMLVGVFMGEVNGRREVYGKLREEEGGGISWGEMRWIVSLGVLILGSVWVGWLTRDVWMLDINPDNKIGMEMEELGGKKVIPLIATILGGVLYGILRGGGRWERVGGVWGRGYDWMDKISNGWVVGGGGKGSYIITKEVEKGALEVLGPVGLKRMMLGLSGGLSGWETGWVIHYIRYMILGLIIVGLNMWICY